ncbi:DoxX family membrane protein [Halosegnis marinus]|uniref:DoxX family membrane protein n=1 Tax=Halosegnis marinus TaxID=3034023 RepID=A0ABD5ZR81_9EURY|nr:DoxX family membrane protein [Halosegnis sp. DT85]
MTTTRGRVTDAARRTAERAPRPGVFARVGLGGMVLLAGVHKLLDPAAWTLYVVDWLEPFLVVSPTTFMLANGWLEVAFGVALLVDRYTAFAAFVAAVSLSATCLYLAAVWATAGLFGDVLARDVGLAGLAWAVTVGALRR